MKNMIDNKLAKSGLSIAMGTVVILTTIAFGIMGTAGIISTKTLQKHILDSSKTTHYLNELNNLNVTIESFSANTNKTKLEDTIAIIDDHKNTLKELSKNATENKQRLSIITDAMVKLDQLEVYATKIEEQRQFYNQNQNKLEAVVNNLDTAISTSLKSATELRLNLEGPKSIIEGPMLKLAFVNIAINETNNLFNRARVYIIADQLDKANKELVTAAKIIGQLKFKTPNTYKDAIIKLAAIIKPDQLFVHLNKKEKLAKLTELKSSWANLNYNIRKKMIEDQKYIFSEYSNINSSISYANSLLHDLSHAQAGMAKIQLGTALFLKDTNKQNISNLLKNIPVIIARTNSASSGIKVAIQNHTLSDYVRDKINQKEIENIHIYTYDMGQKIPNLAAKTAISAQEIRYYEQQLSNTISDISEDVLALVAHLEKQAAKDAEISILVIMLGLILGLIMCITAFILISKKIAHPIKHITDVLQKLSVGDLNVDITTNRKDEIGAMLHAASVFKDNIAELNHVATHDSLTGISNRTSFYTMLERITKSDETSSCIAIHMIDLDKFKEINDEHGHPAGDEVIIKSARRIRNAIRKKDFCARLGGDEFVVIQHGVMKEQDAEQISKRIIKDLCKPIELNNNSIVQVGASIGISTSLAGNSNSLDLVSQADTALYVAKNRGRGVSEVYNESLDQEINSRKGMMKDLEIAMNNKDFMVYFQPRMNLTSQSITSYEALIRWDRSGHGFISPAEFIPITEETGLIIPIGNYVLQEAIRLSQQYLAGGKISVNISPIQFRDKNFIQYVTNILRETGFDPKNLEIEITENALIEDHDLALDIMEQLKQIGISISLDDFGTGYSSFAYLSQFPFDTMKIDQSFIRGMCVSNNNKEIVETMIDLSQRLNLKIVAEGVENEEIFTFLSDRACEEVQGYLLGKPEPIHQIVKDIPQSITNILRDKKARLRTY